MQHQTDAIFLEKYIQEDLIPRGFRINLEPTFSDDDVFIEMWLKIVDKCSTDLLRLLILKRNTLSEISLLTMDLNRFSLHPDFLSFKNKILTNIQIYKFEFINRKRNKLIRDRTDTFSGNYRIWHKHTNKARDTEPRPSIDDVPRGLPLSDTHHTKSNERRHTISRPPPPPPILTTQSQKIIATTLIQIRDPFTIALIIMCSVYQTKRPIHSLPL